MEITFLVYILSVGLIILFVLVTICGIYLIQILKDLSRVVSRLEEISDITSKYIVAPLYTIKDLLSKFKYFKNILDSFKK